MGLAFVGLVLGFSGAHADPVPPKIYDLSNPSDAKRAMPQSAFPLQRQSGGGLAQLKTAEGLTVGVSAAGLRSLSAIALGAKGTLFALNQQGRLFRLEDRDQDGVFETRMVAPQSFNQPSGLVVHDGFLYISDAEAIWRMDTRFQARKRFVNLSNSATKAAPRPLIMGASKDAIIIGLTHHLTNSNDGGQIISIDLAQGVATKIMDTSTQITALSQTARGDLWVGTEGGFYAATDSDALYTIETNASVSGLVMPGQFEGITNWPDDLKDHILISQVQDKQASKEASGGMNVIAIPTDFGVPQKTLRVLLDGFLSPRGRSAWGAPSMMVVDKRGVFIADQWSGHIWRLSAMPVAKIVTIQSQDDTSQDNRDQDNDQPAINEKKPPSIDIRPNTGSQILRGSSITVGSTLGLDKKKSDTPDPVEKNKAP